MADKKIRGNFPASEGMAQVDTIADLKALVETDVDSVTVLGYNTKGDNEARIARFDSASTTNDNGGTVIIPTYSGFGGVGRWLLESKVTSVKDFGATGDGTTNDTAAFTATRTFTNGTYYIPTGEYILDVSPDVWDDPFTTGANVTLIVNSVSFDVSNNFKGQLIAGAWNDTVMDIRGARSDELIFRISDGSASGQSHQAFLPWDIRRDSHSLIFSPGTVDGANDLLWRRNGSDPDPFGNRFNITYESDIDRLIISFATTASGAPDFDSAIQIFGGDSVGQKLVFPALHATFNQGLTVEPRDGITFGVEIIQAASATVVLRDSQTPSNVFMTFRAGAFGFFGSDGTSQQTVTGSTGGNAALESLLTKLATTGLIIDGTTS